MQGILNNYQELDGIINNMIRATAPIKLIVKDNNTSTSEALASDFLIFDTLNNVLINKTRHRMK
jgi:hypothetical protein